VKIKKNIIKTLKKNPIEHDNFLKSYKLFAKVKHNTKEIKSIKKKSLVITGSKDTGSTVLMSEKLNKDLVNSQFKKIDGAKHLCTIEYSLNVNMMIKEFLRI
ncbi:alpha/beta hydrolase, partial [Pelagibacteraceae bacterium]|nr:alpha/beta hydrolase [Pelagibacteraceae bacterium]